MSSAEEGVAQPLDDSGRVPERSRRAAQGHRRCGIDDTRRGHPSRVHIAGPQPDIKTAQVRDRFDLKIEGDI